MSGKRPAVFSARALGWIVGVSVGSFVLAFVLAAFGDDLSRPATAQANSFSYSALGHHAVLEFLERSGFEVTRRRTASAYAFGPSVPLVVAEPNTGQFYVDQYTLDSLYDMAEFQGAPFVVVLPKRVGLPDDEKNWVHKVITLAPQAVEERLGELLDYLEFDRAAIRRIDGERELSCTDVDGRGLEIGLPQPQFLGDSDDLEPLVRCGDDILVARTAARDELPDLVVVSDPDLLNNQGLARADHAELIRWLFADRLGATGVVFDETIHGFERNAGLVSELFRFPLVVALLHGVLLLGLVVWAGIGRFGKPRVVAPRLAAGKQVLIENAAQLLSLGGHSAESLESYFSQTLRAVGAHYFFPPDLPIEELTDRLQRISHTRRVRVDLNDLNERIQRAAVSGKHTERAVRLAARLHRWRQEMTDGSRLREPTVG